ncbi:hypothetical protein PMKS-004121 [Pichia membranifaciens]|uniref:CCHC-type domain-containing protein n=1 Tax=Pichia membranifaciens TaxID=4926 RepID=A0A1Q2YM82_9ASCO|nr:hypothetical protein PMKS-004121 [Pichia membranifaciens]
MSEAARMIEDGDADSYGDALNRTINDEDKLERLERNLQKAKDLNDVGNEKIEDAEKKPEQQKQKNKPAVANEKNGIVYAPSIDEVTADNDHLANLRGEGRYFGVTDPDANQPNAKVAYPSAKIFCYNCAAKGHYGDDCRQMRVSKTPNINGSAFSGDNLPKVLVSQYRNMLNRESQSYNTDNSRKRKFDATTTTNYNYAPPPYPRFNRDNNSNNNNNNNNINNNRNNKNNSRNDYNSNLPRGPKRPSKVGYIPPRNNNQDQGRNNGYSNNYSNYSNNKGNQNSYSSRTSYLNNNNGNNRGSDYNRNSYNRRY